MMMAWRKLAGFGASVLLLTFWIWWLRPAGPVAVPENAIPDGAGNHQPAPESVGLERSPSEYSPSEPFPSKPASLHDASGEAAAAADAAKKDAIRAAETATCLSFNHWRDWSRDWHRRLTPERSLALRNWTNERGLMLPDPDGRAPPQHPYSAYDLATLKTLAANDDVAAKRFLAQRLRSEAPRGSQDERRRQREKQTDERQQLLIDVAASGDIGAVFELRNLARERLSLANANNDTERARRYATEAESWARVAEWRGGFRDNNPLAPREREAVDEQAISTVAEQLISELKQRRQQQGRGEFDNSVLADYETWRGQWRKVTGPECRGFQQQQARPASSSGRRE